jgi:hypothetical protein
MIVTFTCKCGRKKYVDITRNYKVLDGWQCKQCERYYIQVKDKTTNEWIICNVAIDETRPVATVISEMGFYPASNLEKIRFILRGGIWVP